jgi:hypothetical protein
LGKEKLFFISAKNMEDLERRIDELKEKMEHQELRASLADMEIKQLRSQLLAQDKASEKTSDNTSLSLVLSSSISSASLMSIPSDLTLHHPDFEQLVDELSSRVGECYEEEQDAGPSSLVVRGHVGYVYAAWNRLFPDLIKIGATMRAFPYIRVQELSSCAGVPEPFQLVASIPTPEPFALERSIHAFYASVRKYGRKKEFFLLSREEAVYHFHVRSLEAMGSGVSSSVEKVKKRKAAEVGKHRSEYSKLIRDFIISHTKADGNNSKPSRLSTAAFYEKFQEHYKDQEPLYFNYIHFRTEFSKCIQDIHPNVRPSRNKFDRGYIGIELK